MSRICELTGKGVMHGHKVSHSQIKTNRVFLPNLQKGTFFSFILKTKVKFRICAKAFGSVEQNGGIDQYLLKVNKKLLSKKALKIMRALQTVQSSLLEVKN